MSPESDYITINPAVTHGHYNVVLMRWNTPADGYFVFRCSQALRLPAAEALAKSWAATASLEIR